MTPSHSDKPWAIQVGPFTLALEGDPCGFTPSLASEQVAEGLWLVRLTLSSDAPAAPPMLRLHWAQPLVDIHATWHPGREMDRGLKPNWGELPWCTARATSLAPVLCLHSQSGRNRLTFAVDDGLHPVRLQAGVEEETGRVICAMALPEDSQAAGTQFAWTLRLDTRAIDWWQAVNEVAAWWASQPGYEPATVPDVGRLPMYSTWYSMHQQVEPAAVEKQCRLAKQIGCESVIVDDGWQTLDNQRGYAYCGDWEPQRIGDMAAHVKRVHDLGLKYLLWYSVPFVGKHSRAFARFEKMLLQYDDRKGAGVVDPRYPQVREYLIDIYEQALRTWDLDGFKLDFVSNFATKPDTPRGAVDGRDIAGVDDAADRLLSDVMARLRAINPNIMIEFRQPYIGPLMRKYGNLFRAGDCPADLLGNRVRTLDIRAICGSTAPHADMLMWHRDDSVESAALQLLNVLFAVPQISVPLDQVPASHVAMLRFWLAFWTQHRDCLLDGDLQPHHPEQLYPMVVARNGHKTIAAAYVPTLIPLEVPTEELHLINATPGERLAIDLRQAWGPREVVIRDTTGKVIDQQRRSFDPGVHAIDLPPSGLATLRTSK